MRYANDIGTGQGVHRPPCPHCGREIAVYITGNRYRHRTRFARWLVHRNAVGVVCEGSGATAWVVLRERRVPLE